MKRLLSLLFVGCLLVCLCACEKDTGKPTQAPTVASGDPTAAPTDPTPTDPTPTDPTPTDPTPTDPTPGDPEEDPVPTTVSVPQILSLTTTRYNAGAVSSETVSQFSYEGDIATLCMYSGDFLSTRNTYNHKTNTSITASNFFTDGRANHYEYDSYGTQISSKSYKNDELTDSKTTQATYVDGKLMERKTYYANGSLMSHFTYEYDSEGRPTVYIEHSPYREGEIVGRDTFVYDEQGRKIEQISEAYTIDSTLHYYFEYDANGNETKKVCIYDGVESSRYETSYDDQGRIHEVLYYYEGTLKTRGVHLYDEQGYRIGYENYNASGELAYKTAITYEMISVSEDEAESASVFYDTMSKRT